MRHAQIVLLDGSGNVAVVNQSWLRSGKMNETTPQNISNAIQDLISGTVRLPSCVYECAQGCRDGMVSTSHESFPKPTERHGW
jgi:hypothetical protein